MPQSGYTDHTSGRLPETPLCLRLPKRHMHVAQTSPGMQNANRHSSSTRCQGAYTAHGRAASKRLHRHCIGNLITHLLQHGQRSSPLSPYACLEHSMQAAPACPPAPHCQRPASARQSPTRIPTQSPPRQPARFKPPAVARGATARVVRNVDIALNASPQHTAHSTQPAAALPACAPAAHLHSDSRMVALLSRSMLAHDGGSHVVDTHASPQPRRCSPRQLHT